MLSERRAHVATGPHSSEDTDAAQGKHGPLRRAHKHMARKAERTTAERERKTRDVPVYERRSSPHTAWQPNCVHTDIHESQVRLGHKNCSIYTPPSFRMSRAAESRRLVRPTVLQKPESRRRGAARSTALCISAFFPVSVVLLSSHTHIPSLPRVHVGIPFPSVT